MALVGVKKIEISGSHSRMGCAVFCLLRYSHIINDDIGRVIRDLPAEGMFAFVGLKFEID